MSFAFAARILAMSSICTGMLVLSVGCGGAGGPILAAFPETLPNELLIRDVRVLDVASGTIGEPVDVRVRGGLIETIRPVGSLRATEAPVLEGEGATLLPGLIDMHGHVATGTAPAWQISAGPTPDLNMRSYVYSGVTTVFDPGDNSGDAFTRRDAVAARQLVGPQIFSTGPILTAPSGHPLAMLEALVPGWIAWWIAPGIATAVPDVESVGPIVDEIAEAGADGIKIVVDRIPLESERLAVDRAAAIVAAAKQHDLRVVAHVGTTEDALIAARAGVGLWVHGVYKERIPDEAIAELVGFGIPMATTSEVFDSYGRTRKGPIDATRLERETVPQMKLDEFYPLPEDFELGPLEGWLALMEETREVRLDNVRRLHEAGMTILAGSDTQSRVFPGPALHRELQTLVDAGLTPAEAIRAATLDPARWLTREDDPNFGSVAEGKRADLLLVDGDPTEDISALQAIRAVVLHGIPIERTSVLID